MTEAYFMYNEDSFDPCGDAQPNSNDWFDQFRSQREHFVVPECTVEVPEVFKAVSEPLKPDPISSDTTGPSAIDQLIQPCSSHEQLASQIELPAAEQKKEKELRVQEKETAVLSEENETVMVRGAKRRPRNILLISDGKLFQKSRVQKGDRFQTKNLCKHVHTETMRYLKRRVKCHEFKGEEKEQVRIFCQTKASIDNFKALFRNPRIALLCQDFYQSRYFMQEILASKMEMGSKLTVLKYLQKVRRLTYDPDFRAWKKEVY